jgi:hypothetical protein
MADEDKVAALSKMRLEHDDYHMAQDLDESIQRPETLKRKKRRKEPKDIPKGIEKFFTRQ